MGHVVDPGVADGQASVEVSVVMPCLNERNTVAACVGKALQWFRDHGVSGEVVVADNGSTDGSRALAQDAGARVVAVEQRGYGSALMAGIRAARGRYVIMGDSDDSYDFSRLELFLQALRAGNDLVMGNRFKGGIAPAAMPLLHRYLGNPVLSFIGRLFFRVPIGDFHCGLRGFSRDAILKLGLVTQGMEFASEMVAKSALAGYRMAEVPTTLRPDGRGRPAHLRTWRDGWRHLRFLLLYCPRWLFLYPGVFLLCVGVLGLLAGQTWAAGMTPFHVGVHSLLFMGGATMLGIQLVMFAVLSKWMAVMAGLVPVPRWLYVAARKFTIEHGLLLGLLAFLLGLGGSLWITFDWGRAGFGSLDPVETMRVAIPAVTMMIAGMQVATGSAFAGALHSSWTSGQAR